MCIFRAAHVQLFIKSELAIHSLRAKHSKSSDKCIARTAVQIGYARCCAIMGGSPRKVTPTASHLSSQPRHPATGTFISQHPGRLPCRHKHHCHTCNRCQQPPACVIRAYTRKNAGHVPTTCMHGLSSCPNEQQHHPCSHAKQSSQHMVSVSSHP